MTGSERTPRPRHSTTQALALCAVAAGLLLGILVVVRAPVWSWVLTGIALAGAMTGALVTRRRTARRVGESRHPASDADEDRIQRALRRSLRVWPAVPVGTLDPYTFGVSRSSRAERDRPSGGIPPYVDRDVDGVAYERLRQYGLVLLVGAPASGITRTAHRLLATTPSAVALIPESPDGLETAVDECDVLSRIGSRSPVVVWLDRIDRFGDERLTATMVRRLLDRPDLRVVATVSSTHHAAWASVNPAVAEEFGEPVELERLLTPEELGRAEKLYPGIDFGDGIAAAFTDTAGLLSRLRTGNPHCPLESDGDVCILSTAVVEVAADWAATHVRRPLPVDMVTTMTQQRLNRPIDPAHVDIALEWATTPVPGGSPLLAVVTDDPNRQAVECHPVLGDIRGAEAIESVADAVWRQAVDGAVDAEDSEALGRIGFRAHVGGNTSIADDVWVRIATLDEPAAGWLERAAAHSYRLRDAAALLPPRKRILELTDTAEGLDVHKTASAVANLGDACFQLGRMDEARILYERVLAIYESTFGPDGPDAAYAPAVLVRLGETWGELGEPDRSLDLYERALTGFERALGPDHREVADVLVCLGNTLRDVGEPGSARERYERALPICQREFGPDSREVASLWFDLGYAWGELGDYRRTRELYERALPVYEREYGPDSIEVAVVRVALGNTWGVLGKPRRARTLCEQALPVYEREFGPDHAEVATVLVNLGLVWSALGRPGRVRDVYERVLPIWEREFGPGHPKVASVRVDLGNACYRLGRQGEARGHYERALRILSHNEPHDLHKIAGIARMMRVIDPSVVVHDDGTIETGRVAGFEP